MTFGYVFNECVPFNLPNTVDQSNEYMCVVPSPFEIEFISMTENLGIEITFWIEDSTEFYKYYLISGSDFDTLRLTIDEKRIYSFYSTLEIFKTNIAPHEDCF